MSRRQERTAGADIARLKALNKLLGGLLAALVLIGIEDHIDAALAFTQLSELIGIEMCAQCAGHVPEARLT